MKIFIKITLRASLRDVAHLSVTLGVHDPVLDLISTLPVYIMYIFEKPKNNWKLGKLIFTFIIYR